MADSLLLSFLLQKDTEGIPVLTLVPQKGAKRHAHLPPRAIVLTTAL